MIRNKRKLSSLQLARKDSVRVAGVALASQEPSIHGDDGTGCVARRGHAKECYSAGDVVGLTPPLESGAICDPLIMREILSPGLSDACFDVTRCYRVDAD